MLVPPLNLVLPRRRVQPWRRREDVGVEQRRQHTGALDRTRQRRHQREHQGSRPRCRDRRPESPHPHGPSQPQSRPACCPYRCRAPWSRVLPLHRVCSSTRCYHPIEGLGEVAVVGGRRARPQEGESRWISTGFVVSPGRSRRRLLYERRTLHHELLCAITRFGTWMVHGIRRVPYTCR